MQVVGDELVEAFQLMVGDVEEDGAVFFFAARADERDGFLVALHERRQQRGHKGLGQHLGQRHFGKQRNETRDEQGILRGLDDEGELHGWRGHFNSLLGAGVERAVHDVGPVDHVGHGLGVEAELGLANVGKELGARGVVRVKEFAARAGRVLLAGAEVLLVGRGEEGRLMMVEPPGDARRGGVLEVDDGILVADEFGLVEESACAVHQAVVLVDGVAGDALAVEAGEERGRAGSVETLVVIENANLQNLHHLV